MFDAGCQVQWSDGPAAHQPELLLQEGYVLCHEGRDRLLDMIQAKEEKCGWLIVSELAGNEPLAYEVYSEGLFCGLGAHFA